MILLDSDVMIDILRNYPPAMEWFDALDENEEIALPGYVLMELIQGCRSKAEQDHLQRAVDPYGVVWPTPEHCYCRGIGEELGKGVHHYRFRI
ncbi:MAG: hypothetical protein U5R49_20605 [Deltaproteobacteria bacterium]|nr:hypothetical protein [Deltaproteobacteria bacterium]